MKASVGSEDGCIPVSMVHGRAALGRKSLGVFLVLVTSACNVHPVMENTGGISDEEPSRPGCPRGLTVLLSDFQSTQVALSALDGRTLSASFLSTSSRQTDGLAFALSGDVVLPSEPPPSGRVVLIDRYGTNVVSFAEPSTARVLGQLPVATGFEANPYDYIEVDDERAYVARYGHNADPGRQAFDAGDDVLVIDSVAPRILGRIPLGEADDPVPPRPTRFARLGKEILLTLERVSLDYSTFGDSEIVGLNPEADRLTWRSRIEGLQGCGRLAASPDGSVFALACTGGLDKTGQSRDLTRGGLVFLDARAAPPKELERISIAALTGEPIQSEVVFLSDRFLLLKTQTALEGRGNNRLFAWDRQERKLEELLVARPDANGRGLGVVYGALVCDPGCSDVCWLADADRRVIERVRLVDDHPVVDLSVEVETRVGLPPRDLLFR